MADPLPAPLPPRPFPTGPERARFQQLQAYEDAIAYRAARLAAPCPACATRRCDDHATDAALIAGYQQAAAACPVTRAAGGEHPHSPAP
jgi:hypothetical protein